MVSNIIKKSTPAKNSKKKRSHDALQSFKSRNSAFAEEENKNGGQKLCWYWEAVFDILNNTATLCLKEQYFKILDHFSLNNKINSGKLKGLMSHI